MTCVITASSVLGKNKAESTAFGFSVEPRFCKTDENRKNCAWRSLKVRLSHSNSDAAADGSFFPFLTK